MVLEETRVEVLEINLDALREEDKREGIIKVSDEIIASWYEHLIQLERYEDCQTLKNNESIMKYN